jgi:tetratricopeptide (TPR) repeat protein
VFYGRTGRREKAVKHLEAVAKCDPNDANGAITLAWMHYLDGRMEEAAEQCARADRIDPSNVMNRKVWGLVLLKQRRWSEAEKQFRRAVEVAPTEGEYNRGLSEALRHQGRAEEAVRFARRALRWTEEPTAEILLTLGEAYAAAGRESDARTTLEQALSIAERSNSDLAPTIRARLEALP